LGAGRGRVAPRAGSPATARGSCCPDSEGWRSPTRRSGVEACSLHDIVINNIAWYIQAAPRAGSPATARGSCCPDSGGWRSPTRGQSRVKGALQLLINRYGQIHFAHVHERVSTKSFVVLIIGNSKSNHLGVQGTLNPRPWERAPLFRTQSCHSFPRRADAAPARRRQSVNAWKQNSSLYNERACL